jgi:DNA-directed RNA polymerase subunit F
MGGAITPELWERWKEIRSGRIKPVDPVDPIQKQVDELTKLLGLNREQAAQLKEILTKQQAEINALMKDPTTDRTKLAAMIEQIKKQYDAMIIKQLGLTDAQIAMYNRWRGIREIKPVDPVDPIQQQVDHMTKLLGLNADQATQLKEILKSQQEQINALMSDRTLDRATLAEKIAEIQKETDGKILEGLGLTEDQKAIYLKWKTGGIRPRG